MCNMNIRKVAHSLVVTCLLIGIGQCLSKHSESVAAGKRRYMTASGMKKVKRYLQRRYQEMLQQGVPNNKRAFYTNTWAVEVKPPTQEVADMVAKKHGFINIGKIGNLDGHFHFKHVETSSKVEKRDHIKTGLLTNERNVLKATQQVVLDRYKRDGFPNDPKYLDMWYLHNTGQEHSPAGVDLNVQAVWNRGITGKGVVISVLDDGLDHTHPDLIENYDKAASCDLNDNDDDPMPRDTDPDNCHGTRCAGEAVAAANNSVCGVGVAYNAKIGGVRMLDGQATDALEASALGYKNDHIHVYINCWGPKDDGKTFGKPGPIATRSLKEAAEKGRDGLGNIYVWATGNGGLTDDDCNCDGYTTSIYTISIGCIGDHGTSAYYTEKCSSTLAVTFNGASHREGKENKMVTTDLYHGCTEEFKGTSASAPLAAGVFALVLETNPKVSWRDLQDLIVKTAQMTSPVDDGWKRNAVGYHYNLKFGFGRLDANLLCKAAKDHKPLGPHTRCVVAKSDGGEDSKKNIPLKSGAIKIAAKAQDCVKGEDDDDGNQSMPVKLEHVILTVSFVHKRRGDVAIKLYSPGGTESEMLSTRKYDDSNEGLDEWNFMTVFNWGESPTGEWKIVVSNNPDDDTSDLSNFGSDSNDVESLEEDVIDAQMKSKWSDWDARRKTNPYFTLPYPTGVKREEIPGYSLHKEERNNDKDYKRSIIEDIDEYFLSPKSTIPRPQSNAGRLIHVSDNNKLEEIPTLEDDKVNSRSTINHKKTLYKKVQVQEEETGVPRVQVNAGYEHAPIECVGGEDCSGVLLNWKITVFGSL